MSVGLRHNLAVFNLGHINQRIRVDFMPFKSQKSPLKVNIFNSQNKNSIQQNVQKFDWLFIYHRPIPSSLI